MWFLFHFLGDCDCTVLYHSKQLIPHIQPDIQIAKKHVRIKKKKKSNMAAEH